MSTEENKAVVRRFMTEALARGDADVLDEPLAPGCNNPMTEASTAQASRRCRVAGSDAGACRPDPAARRLTFDAQ